MGEWVLKTVGVWIGGLCLVLAATTAGAMEHNQGQGGTFGDWSFEVGQGIRASRTESGGASLDVTCAPPEVFVKSSLYLGVDGQRLSGKMGFRFNDGETVVAVFENNEFVADTAERAQMFGQVVSGLKRGNTVELVDGDATIATFSLRGSSKAIGDCTIQIFDQ